jgi:hypothetical protein
MTELRLSTRESARPIPARRRQRGHAAAAAALVVAALCPAGAQAGNTTLEYAVKAAYLYKLAAFVQWPNSAFPSPSSPLKLCVEGHDPFGPLLKQVVDGHRIGTHPVVVSRSERLDGGTGCHILYLATTSAPSAEDALESLRGDPVLTVTDSAFESAAPGIVHFVLQGNHVRFQIDGRAAAQNGIVISSKLMSLAVAPG